MKLDEEVKKTARENHPKLYSDGYKHRKGMRIVMASGLGSMPEILRVVVSRVQ